MLGLPFSLPESSLMSAIFKSCVRAVVKPMYCDGFPLKISFSLLKTLVVPVEDLWHKIASRRL